MDVTNAKRSNAIFYSMCIILFCCSAISRQAIASELFSVQLGEFVSYGTLQKKANEYQYIKDLWSRKTGEEYVLYAGIFPKDRYAELLCTKLSERGLECDVVPATMPKRNEWLPSPYTVTLKDIGYNQPVLISGVNAYRAFQFPWHDSLDIRTASLTMLFRISQFLRPDSSITITVEGIPLASFSAQEIKQHPEITLGLDILKNMNIGKSLDVEISGTLSASSNRCADMLSKNLWLIAEPESRLETVQKWPPASPAIFFSDPSSQFNFAAIDETIDSITPVVRIAGLVGSVSGSMKSRIHFVPYMLSGRNIFTGNFSEDVKVLGSNIYMTGAGARLVASRWLPALLFPHFRVQVADEAKEKKEVDISFEDLGLGHQSARGRGDLVFFVNFSPLDMGGWPDRLICTLVYSHSPVGRDERSFLRIRLNGILIESREIKGQGGRQTLVFDIPARYLKEQNSLEFAFSYYLNTGDCLGSYPEFEVSILKDSFFSVTGFKAYPPITLSTFSVLAQGRGALVLSEPKPEFYKPAARLAEILGHMQHRVPHLSVSTKLPAKSSYDYALLVLEADKAFPFSPPVDIAPHFQVKNPLNDKVLVDMDTNESVTVVESFYGKQDKIPMLLLGWRNTAQFPEKTLTELFAARPIANVGIIHQDQWHAMEVGKKFRVIYPDRRSIAYYWMRYRLAIFLILGTVVMVFLFYIYDRLAKEK